MGAASASARAVPVAVTSWNRMGLRVLGTRYAFRSTTFSLFSVEAVNHSGNTSHTNTTQTAPLRHPTAPVATNDTDVFLQVNPRTSIRSSCQTSFITCLLYTSPSPRDGLLS